MQGHTIVLLDNASGAIEPSNSEDSEGRPYRLLHSLNVPYRVTQLCNWTMDMVPVNHAMRRTVSGYHTGGVHGVRGP